MSDWLNKNTTRGIKMKWNGGFFFMETVAMLSCFSLAKIWRQCPRLSIWLAGSQVLFTTLITEQWTTVCETDRTNEGEVKCEISSVCSCCWDVPSKRFVRIWHITNVNRHFAFNITKHIYISSKLCRATLIFFIKINAFFPKKKTWKWPGFTPLSVTAQKLNGVSFRLRLILHPSFMKIFLALFV